jgi:ABC-type multidrug transport system permease subunit
MGIGLGLVLVSLFPTLVSNALIFGIVLIIVAFVLEMMMGKKVQ